MRWGRAGYEAGRGGVRGGTGRGYEAIVRHAIII